MTMKISIRYSTNVGACDCCDKHGMTPHNVAVLTAGHGNHTTSLRFCEGCFNKLKTIVFLSEVKAYDKSSRAS